jgi:serine phosphatase RsbU (regulator of sigma subunit)/tetratricopeptide (TPR) repeat protein
LKSLLLFLSLFLYINAQAQLPASVQNEININDEQAEQYLKEGNLSEAAKLFNQSAYLLRNHQKNEEAAKRYEKIIEINKQLNNQRGLLMTHNNLGMVYLDLEFYEKAIPHLEKALEITKKTDSKESVISSYTNIAVALQGLGRYKESNSQLDAAVEMAKDLNDIKLLRRCYGIIYENYEKLGQSDKSYQYFELYSSLDKELKKREMQQVKKEAETEISKAQAEKQLTQEELKVKEKELQITTSSLMKAEELTYEQKLELEVKGQELKIKDAQLKLETVRKKFAYTGLAVTVFFLVVVSLLLVKLRVAHKQIIYQNNILDRQNKNITSSIRYALTIQQAMLPDEVVLKEYFNPFIIYKPKDIVSGDFYWFSAGDKTKKDNKYFLSLVDCTGHGVPGAFMSMIGNRLLSEIVNERKIEDPKEVLEILNHEIRVALRQEKTDNNDGMDISFCCFERKNGSTIKITYAGAKRTIYCIRKDTGEFISLKGDRRSIGGLGEKKDHLTFTNHEVDFTPGDMLYLSTDGLIDQNGPDRKRYGSKRFEDFLVSLYAHPVEKQKELFEHEIETFMNSQDQRDDITIFGVQLK